MHLFPEIVIRREFNQPRLPLEFQWLRSPWPDQLFSLAERPGFLRLYGRESLGSVFFQALIARRQQSHCCSASTTVEFEPATFQQMAGLICYYNGSKYHYLAVSLDEALGKTVRIISSLPDRVPPDVFGEPVAIPSDVPVHLRVEIDYERLFFAFRTGGRDWQWMPGPLDAAILSDESGPSASPNFTGAFVGMCCQDSAGTCLPADFDHFCYRDRDYVPDSKSIQI
jgi:xylan 1,4-beta-xylosidase